MSVEEDDGEMEEVGRSHADFFDNEPSKQEKIDMRKAVKPPSEWLRLLCREWAMENEVLVETTDAKLLDYKPYSRGLLTSQLLCRLSIPSNKEHALDGGSSQSLDFWEILGINDSFDRAYIVAQIERFCALYSIRAVTLDDEGLFPGDLAGTDPTTLAAAAAAGIAVSPGGGIMPLPPYIDQSTAAAAAVAAAAATDMSKLSKKQVSQVSKAHRLAKDAEKALELERRQNKMREQRRLTQERKEQKTREREVLAIQKANDRAERESTREERRKKKLEIRLEREKFSQEAKDAALRRAAELVASNRVPIEITRGSAAAKAVVSTALSASIPSPQIPDRPGRKKSRSAIVVSTATDLNQIVTHSKNLWNKYNAIAKEHNQKVNWNTVAKELGIHVKVREKYARMHFRAEQRAFDWRKYGHWKIKDHPEIFLEPTQAEQRAKMPPPPPDLATTVLIEGNKEVTEDAVAAAAAVVDASVTAPPVDAASLVQTTEEQTAAAAAVAATLVADPTAEFVVDGSAGDTQIIESIDI